MTYIDRRPIGFTSCTHAHFPYKDGAQTAGGLCLSKRFDHPLGQQHRGTPGGRRSTTASSSVRRHLGHAAPDACVPVESTPELLEKGRRSGRSAEVYVGGLDATDGLADAGAWALGEFLP